MIRSFVLAAAIATAAALPATVEARRPTNPQVDYAGFRKLTVKLNDYRAERLLDWDAWRAAGDRQGALILDARSADAYARGHIKGAVNLPFTDFTAESLAAVIGPNRDRPILIYCNNNFINDKAPVPMKAVPLALNIQTFINLYGYGYPNVWELNDQIDFTDPKVGWIATETAQRTADDAG